MSNEWWRTAVIYQVYIRSFADGDGDGIGDLAGIRSRLPYLRDLGVDAVWITPFYPSPMADGGYDVADYRDIEPVFGTLADADALVAEAHDLGLRVIVDIVPNHSSDRHAWFQAALAAGPGSHERSRYVFRPGRGPDGAEPPTDWQSLFGGPAWTRVPDGEWYLHLFAAEQPDFDWENPEVVEEFEDILRFWLDRGVDGFRIDVANALKKDQAFPDVGAEDEGVLVPHQGPAHPFWDRDEVHEVYRGWRKVSDTYAGDRAYVAEAWVDDPARLALYTRPDELHTAFNFNFVRAAWDADELRRTIDVSTAAATEVGAPTTWVLSNHDVTRHATRYARLDRTGGGVADDERVRPDTPLHPELGLRRARAAVLLLLGLPGSAYVYQGEDLLGQVDDLGQAELLALVDVGRPDLGTVRAPAARPGRLPGAGAVGARRPVAGFRRRGAVAAPAGRLGRPVGAGPAGRRRLDARALPQRAPAAPRAARRRPGVAGQPGRLAGVPATHPGGRGALRGQPGHPADRPAGVRPGAARQRPARRRPPGAAARRRRRLAGLSTPDRFRTWDPPVCRGSPRDGLRGSLNGP